MNNTMISLEFEGLKDLDGKSTDQTLGDSLKVIVFDEFVEVDTEAFEGYQEMLQGKMNVVSAMTRLQKIGLFLTKITPKKLVMAEIRKLQEKPSS